MDKLEKVTKNIAIATEYTANFFKSQSVDIFVHLEVITINTYSLITLLHHYQLYNGCASLMVR